MKTLKHHSRRCTHRTAAPQYLGATLPLDGYGIIQLGSSGHLTASAPESFAGNTIALTPAPHMAAVLTRTGVQFVRQNTRTPIPFDRLGSITSNTQIAEATPTKLDLGWLFGTVSNAATPTLTLGEARYGDISKIDIQRAIREHLGNTAAVISGFNTDNLTLESTTKAQLVTYVANQNAAVSAANPKRLVSGAAQAAADYSATTKPIAAAVQASYTGEFAQTGVFFLSPTLDAADMNNLRSGNRLGDKDDVFIRITGLTVDGKANQSFLLKVKFTDFTSDPNRVFFGDRPLSDPGYTAFALSGTVGAPVQGQPVPAMTSQRSLDVWRVEQRLKYLGYPAMGLGTTASANTMPQNFNVDGTWGAAEGHAAWLFHRVVNYNSQPRDEVPNTAQTTQLVNHGSGASFSRVTYNTTLGAAAKAITISAADSQFPMFNWLNAWNAPHWVKVDAFMNRMTGRWVNTQDGSAVGKFENWGTSWMGDWITAQQYAPSGLLRTQALQFNGATDGNHNATPSEHVSHDLGMAFDVGFVRRPTGTTGPGWISSGISTNNSTNNEMNELDQPPDASFVAGQWNDAFAQWFVKPDAQTGLRGSSTADTDGFYRLATGTWANGINDQRAIAAEIMSFYSITQSSSSGYTTARSHMTGNVTDKETKASKLFGLFNRVFVGGTGTKNALPDVNLILRNQLGIASSALPPHEHHFHIVMKVPVRYAIESPRLLTASERALNTLDPIDNLENPMLEPLLQALANPPALIAQDLVDQGVWVAGAQSEKYDRVQINQLMGRHIDITDDFTISARSRLTLPKVANWNPDSPITVVKFLDQPKFGKLTKIDQNNYHYQPTHLGTEILRYVVQNTDGRKAIVTWRIEIRASEERGQLMPDTNWAIAQQGTPSQWLQSANLSAMLANATSQFTGYAALPSAAIGTTTGSGLAAQIQLDNDAAGHGWYVDAGSPLSLTPTIHRNRRGRGDEMNADYLPTSDPTVWKAKAGSAAAGRMDMLSVLLHEYGHALGLAHSGDGRDFMSATLAPGVRKLPSEAELELMAHLVAELKAQQAGTQTPLSAGADISPALQGQTNTNNGQSNALFSHLHNSPVLPYAIGGMSAPADRGVNAPQTSLAPTHIDYLSATLPTLANGNFAAGLNGWESTGNVQLAAKDPTVSLQERFTNHAGYVTALTKATQGAISGGGGSAGGCDRFD